MVLFAAIAIGAVLLLTKRPPVQYTPPVTGNATRDSTVTTILAMVAGAGGTITAIQKLIEQIQGMSDTQVQQYKNQVTAGGGAPVVNPDGSGIDYSNFA